MSEGPEFSSETVLFLTTLLASLSLLLMLFDCFPSPKADAAAAEAYVRYYRMEAQVRQADPEKVSCIIIIISSFCPRPCSS